MKKIAIFVSVALCLVAAVLPTSSRAAISPHFMAVNDTLLPFEDANMPFISGGTILVPYNILSSAGVWSFVSGDSGRVLLYRGNRQADFSVGRGVTEDREGNALNWPPAQRIGVSTYVPLHQVCEYFGLAYELIEVGRNVIPDRQIWVVRIISGDALTSAEFVDQYRGDMIASYYGYYGPPPSPSSTTPPTTPPPGETPPEPPTEEPPPSYSDVAIYLSFYDISAGSAERILNQLGASAAPISPSCFFVSAGDIMKHPGLVRKISGSGHAIGVLLEEGTLEEYLEASALLFEAAKIKTVLISTHAPGKPENGQADAGAAPLGETADAGEASANEPAPADADTGGSVTDAAAQTAQAAIATAYAHGLIYWGASQSFGAVGDASESAVTDGLPTASGERRNLSFSCSDVTASMLPDVLSFLRTHEYAVTGIVETTAPAW